MRPDSQLQAGKLTERDVVSSVVRFLRSEGFRVRTEVPNMGQSMDIAATRGRWVTAVEVKVRDWRTALRQCVAHEVVADFICVAIATVRASEKLLAQARERGYGVILVRNPGAGCSWVNRPTRNRSVWLPQRQQFSKHLARISDVA